MCIYLKKQKPKQLEIIFISALHCHIVVTLGCMYTHNREKQVHQIHCVDSCRNLIKPHNQNEVIWLLLLSRQISLTAK